MLIFKFIVLLIPIGSPLIRGLSSLVSYQVSEVDVGSFDGFKLIHFARIGDMLLVFEKFVGHMWLKV